MGPLLGKVPVKRRKPALVCRASSRMGQQAHDGVLGLSNL